MSEPQDSPRARLQRKRRGCLLGCLITLAVVLIAGGAGWLYVRSHLGELASGIIREEAAKSLNGRLTFDKLDIDLAGRAVLHNAEIYTAGEAQPVFSCPTAVARFDPFNFIGPNRGRRAVELTLNQPRIIAVREPDGSFNLIRLKKERSEDEQPIGFSVRFREAQVAFTDWCLLDENYPQLAATDELARQLLSKLGYQPGGAPEQRIFEETFTLDGTAVINNERKELAFNLEAKRPAPGGVIALKGGSNFDGTDFDVRAVVRGLELASLRGYSVALFPKLVLEQTTDAPGSAQAGTKAAQAAAPGKALAQTAAPVGPVQPPPTAAGLIREATVHAVQATGQPLALTVDAELVDARAECAPLPALALPRLKAHYDPSPQRVNGEFTLQALGAEVQASGRYDIGADKLEADAKLAEADVAKLLAQLKVKDVTASGTLSAQAKLTGPLKQLLVEATLSSTPLKFDKLALGKLRGAVKLEQQVLSLSGVELAGGELPLRASGKLNLASRSGELSATAGPLTVADGLSLAARFNTGEPLPKLDAQGKFQAAATVKLAAGQPRTKLRVWSDALDIQGYKLAACDIQGEAGAHGIQLDGAQATLTLPQAVDAAGFTSKGPLKAAVRAGGSISLPRGQPAVLALSGSAVTQNLAPAQATLNFKAAGPADAPELKVQLKTKQAEHPLVLAATAKYKPQGHTPVSAKLTWFDTAITFAGGVNPAKQSMSGKLKAESVDLARFAGKQGCAGTLSLTADVGGTFKAPTLAGKVVAPRLAYAKDARHFELTNGSAGFKLAQGNSISVSDGAFDFAGNRFKLGGTLGGDKSSLEIRSDPFNLFNVLATVTNAGAQPGVKTAPGRPPLDIDSKGVLLVKLTGKLDDPQASFDYSSPGGAVQGQHYSDARLLGTANKTQASISNFSLKSASGGITASAVVRYEPLAYQAGAQVNNFNLGVITPVIGIEMLNQLTGLLNGTASVKGEGQHFTADGALTLAQGKFGGMALDSAQAQFRTSGQALEVTSLTVAAQGTQLTASGVISPDMAQTRFTASAPRLELALLNPLLPNTLPQLGGVVKLDASFAPGRGKYPEMNIALSDNGAGIKVDGTSLTAVNIKAQLANDSLAISQGDFKAAGSQLTLSGGIELGKGRQVQGRESFPLDFAVRSQNVDISALLAALPANARANVPPGLGGSLTCDVHLSGMSHNPALQGTVGFDLDLANVAQAQGFGLNGLSGQIVFDQNEFKNLDLQLKAAEGSGLSTARITGSGTLALNPLRLAPGSAIDIALAPAGGSTVLSASYPGTGSFNGSLAGTIHVRGTSQPGLLAEVSGSVIFNAANQKSTIFFKMPDASLGQQQTPAPFRFGNPADPKSGLQLIFKPGTEVEGPYDLKAQLNGSIILHGRPGVQTPPDKFEISGRLQLPEGSLFIYRHTIRLDKNYGNFLSFSGGELFPYLTARGALVLPNALAGEDLGAAQTVTGVEQAHIGNERDLTVYFTFNNVRLGTNQEQLTNELQLSSQPPLDTAKIQKYLLGGAGELLAGRGDFGEIAQGELLGLGTSFISREIERMFNLEAFRVGADGGGAYYTYVEKALNDDVSLTYYKDFFSQTGQKEQWGVKYQIYDISAGSRLQNLTLNVNLTDRGYGGSDSEFMFVWNTKF
jgi:hypothetical protein